MSGPQRLDPDRPMTSLREALGLNREQMARRRGVTRPSQHDVEEAGDGVRLRTLREAAAKAGGEVSLTFEPGVGSTALVDAAEAAIRDGRSADAEAAIGKLVELVGEEDARVVGLCALARLSAPIEGRS